MWNWFKNMSTMAKLMMAFAAAGAITAFVGYSGVTSMGMVMGSTENVYNVQLKPLMTLTQVRGMVHQTRANTLTAVLTKSDADREEAIRKVRELGKQIDESREAFAKTIKAEDVQKAYDEFAKAYDDYRQFRDEKVFRPLVAGDQALALSNMKGEGASKFKASVDAINKVVDVKMKVAQDKYDGAAKTYADSKTNLTIIVLGGLFLGLLAGWAVARLLSRALTDIGAAAAKMAEGDYSARSTVSSKDEAGQLAQAFNQMSETLQQAAGKQAQALAAQAAEISGITNAISKSQASIEFNLDGTILTANDNFCQAVGYRLEEIKGQHHRIFCDPAYTSSPEYTAFWQKLNRGEFDAGQYRRFGKGGKEIWIQASYNPVADANGKICKVVKFATDITAQKKAQAELEACMAEAQQALGALAQGDLTREMRGAYQGELEKIKTSINAALSTLTHTITTVRDAVENVTTGSEQITKGNEDLSQRTSEQASALEETSASMEQMTSTVKQNADNARQANQLATAARDVAEKGGAVTNRAVAAMGEINNSSKKIADIITVIDEIAFQTNLLALNAAVEAARAGEHGRGFAVVAAEVRNLAQRSASAAKEIKGLINESIQRVNDGSDLVNQSGKTLEEIVNSVKRVTDIVSEIAAASQEQASGIDQVNKAIMQMDQTTQQNAALVEETTSASVSMKDQAKELMRQVEVFKVQAGAAGPSGSSRLAASKPAVKTVSRPAVASKPSASAAKSVEAKEAVGVGASNGKDRRQADNEFEEF